MFVDLYIDESIGRSKERLITAGFVSDIDRWAVFASAWKKQIIAPYNVPYLRMKDFRNPEAAIYKHLSKGDREHLLGAAIELIRSHAGFGVVSEINPKRYHELTTRAFRDRNGSPYAAAVISCVFAAADLHKQVTGDAELNVYLEDGHVNAREVRNILEFHKTDAEETLEFDRSMKDNADRPVNLTAHAGGVEEARRLSLGTIALGSKRSNIPLQAADFLAYCWLNQDQMRFRNLLEEVSIGTPIFRHSWTDELISLNVNKFEERDRRKGVHKQSLHKLSRFLGNFEGFVRPVKGGHHIHVGSAFEMLPVNSFLELIEMAANYDIHALPTTEKPSAKLHLFGIPELESRDEISKFLYDTDGYIEFFNRHLLQELAILHCGSCKVRRPLHAANAELVRSMIEDEALIRSTEFSRVGRVRYRLKQSASHSA